MLQPQIQHEDQNGKPIRSILGNPIFPPPSENEKYPLLNSKTMFQEFSYNKFLVCKMFNFMHPTCFPSSFPLHHG